MKKILISMAVVTLLSSIVLFLSNSNNRLDELILANVEALASGEGSGFDCVLEKDDCTFTVSTNAQLNIIKKQFPFAGIGVAVDLSSGTQIYREKYSYETGVRCGEDITCNTFLRQLGLI